jgi:hypothetical protein
MYRKTSTAVCGNISSFRENGVRLRKHESLNEPGSRASTFVLCRNEGGIYSMQVWNWLAEALVDE